MYLLWKYFHYWNSSFMLLVRVQSWVRVDFIRCRTWAFWIWILFVTWEKIVAWGCQNTVIQLRQKRHHLYEDSLFPLYFKCLFLVLLTVPRMRYDYDREILRKIDFHYLFSVHAEHLAGGNITTEFISLIMSAADICPQWLLFPADMKLRTVICNFIALYLNVVLRRTLGKME